MPLKRVTIQIPRSPLILCAAITISFIVAVTVALLLVGWDDPALRSIVTLVQCLVIALMIFAARTRMIA